MKITVDYENNAETFWTNFRVHMPALAARFDLDSTAELTTEEWEKVQTIEGFADGPDYGREALLVTE
jgi:hypothetical protein